MRNQVGILLFIVGWLHFSVNAFACDCKTPTISHRFRTSDVVFTGEIVEITDSHKVTFQVFRQWKGDGIKEIKVKVFDLPDICGDMVLRKGLRYLVFASKDNQSESEWTTNGDCGQNVPLTQANFEIKILDCIANMSCNDLPLPHN
ncbi:MAG: hypothetical protein JNM09_05720 [Blastocatellia bacterium]|nr:hypothetical protein [Blastocatellia bacterium]